MCLRGNFRTNRIQIRLTYGSQSREFEVGFVSVYLFWHQLQSPTILHMCSSGFFFCSKPRHAVKLLSVLRYMAHRTGPDSFFSFTGKNAAVSTHENLSLPLKFVYRVFVFVFWGRSQAAASSFHSFQSATTQFRIHVSFFLQPVKPKPVPVRWFKMAKMRLAADTRTSAVRLCAQGFWFLEIVAILNFPLWCIYEFLYCSHCSQTCGGGLSRQHNLYLYSLFRL